MNGYVLSFLLFVVGIVFGLLIFTVLLRLVLQIVRADFYNPISQFLLRITNPMLLPLRRIIPGLFGIDMAAVVLLVILEALEIVVTHLLQGSGLHTPLLFLAELLGMIIQHTAQLFFISILIMVVISWISRGRSCSASAATSAGTPTIWTAAKPSATIRCAAWSMRALLAGGMD